MRKTPVPLPLVVLLAALGLTIVFRVLYYRITNTMPVQISVLDECEGGVTMDLSEDGDVRLVPGHHKLPLKEGVYFVQVRWNGELAKGTLGIDDANNYVIIGCDPLVLTGEAVID